MYYVVLVSLIIAALSVGVAIISIVAGRHAFNREYEYNFDPEVEIMTGIGVLAQEVNGDKVVKSGIDNVSFQILVSNNLNKAYLINSDYSITEIEISDEKGNPSENIPFGEPDLTINDKNYYYKFVLLEGLDDTYTLTLVYSKYTSNDRLMESKALTGIEVLELEKGHEDDPDYEGERVLAQKYAEMVGYCQKYLMKH